MPGNSNISWRSAGTGYNFSHCCDIAVKISVCAGVMEGGSLVQVSRILAGKPLYVQPSFEFIPQIYTPLYFYISALASLFLGNSFLPLRFVSIVSSLGILVLIFVLVRQQTGSKVSGFLASGLFFSTYKLSGYWFDIARVDSLALVLFLISLYFFLRNTPTSCGLGGIFLALSFLYIVCSYQTGIL
ncbi:MAG: glycosyltransferase family 39 protein [Chloroflexota bacterium]